MGEFSALMAKNWVLYKRGCFGNLCEIFIPILFCLFIIFFSQISPPELILEQSYLTNSQYSKVFDSTSVNSIMRNCPTNSIIAIAPASSTLANSLNNLFTANLLSTKLYENQAQIQSFIRSFSYSGSSKQICWAVIIQNQSNNYQYKLRFNTSNVGLNNVGPQTSTPPLTSDIGIDLNSYQVALDSGIMGANYLINNLIFQKQLGSNNKIIQTSAPAYQQLFEKDTIYQNLYRWIDIIYLLPLLIVYARQTLSMLSQKQTKVIQNMRIMGMKMKTYYFTWFLRYFIIFCIIHGIAAGIIAYKLPYVPFYIPLIVFILFDILIIIQNFFIQIFFSKARLGITIAFIFFLAQYAVCYVVSNTNPGERIKTLLSIVPHVAFVFAFQNIFYFQSQKTTASFTQSINSYTLLNALLIFSGNILFYLILIWIFRQVIPSQWGQKKQPLSCLCPKSSRSLKNRKRAFQKAEIRDYQDNTFLQMVEISKLHKQYDSVQNLAAVDNVELKFRKNEIFVLVGEKGAGKTTIISMLSGIISPTSGKIRVFGQLDMDIIQEKLGFCPESNALYQNFTVAEQLNLFICFKGLNQSKCIQLLRDFRLTDRKNELVERLNQCQKRQLSIAISFAGKQQFIVLDQPTAGMDQITRKYIWDTLSMYKRDRIILLTTNLMDQADYIGDRVGIMSKGRLLCHGSTTFLKEKYGLGYKITFVKQSYLISSNKIISLIKKTIPNAVVLLDAGFQLSIQIPLRQAKYFSSMFQQIDFKKKQLGITSYGVNMANLEEIFLTIDNKNRKYESQQIKQNMIQQKNIERQKNYCILFINHFRATFVKRFRILIRDFRALLLQFILPLAIIVGTAFFIRGNYINDPPAQTINLNIYLSQQNPVAVPMGSANMTFLNNIKASLNTSYQQRINLKIDNNNVLVNDFDKKYLSPLKKAQKSLKGGIYFQYPNIVGPNKQYSFTSLSITRSPTSYFFLPSLATQALINSQAGKNIEITVVNHPLPLTYDQLSLGTVISGFLAAFLFTLAFAFNYSSTLSFIVKEKQDKVKKFYLLNGMKISAYWFANYIFDYLLYLLLAVTAGFLCYYLKIQFLTKQNALQSIKYLFAAYGLACIPFTYMFAFFFKQHGNAQPIYLFLTIFIGGLLPGLTFALRYASSSLNQLGRSIAWILRIHPAFAFGEGIVNLSCVNIYKTFQNNNIIIDPLSLQISCAPIIYLFGEILLYFIILSTIQNCAHLHSYWQQCRRSRRVVPSQNIVEKDVKMQQNVAINAPAGKFQILTKHLRKQYNDKVAVSNLSLAIKKNEVFGLVGDNRAGKSTTLKLLSGQTDQTYGQGYISNFNIDEESDQVNKIIGFCPQNDVFLQTLTVREQIQLLYDIRSLKSQKEIEINKIINDLGLKESQNVISGELSGSNKRKLSIAMAIIGNPKVIFLDQPSKGMDPVSKRLLWKKISKISFQNRISTIILTTTSLSEAEAISSRLAIMNQGKIKCIGMIKQFKQQFGDIVEVQIKLKPFYKKIKGIIQKKKLEDHHVVSKRQLQDVLNKLNATNDSKTEIKQNGFGMHIYKILDKDKQISLDLIVGFLQAFYIFGSIFRDLQKLFGAIELLDVRPTYLKVSILKILKMSELFVYFESKKQFYGIQQYIFKKATIEQIFKKMAQTKNSLLKPISEIRHIQKKKQLAVRNFFQQTQNFS